MSNLDPGRRPRTLMSRYAYPVDQVHHGFDHQVATPDADLYEEALDHARATLPEGVDVGEGAAGDEARQDAERLVAEAAADGLPDLQGRSPYESEYRAAIARRSTSRPITY